MCETAMMVKGCAFEVPPPGAGVTTVTLATPAVARSLAAMAAVSWVAETKVVVRGLPFHWTTESVMKPVPFTVRVKAAAPTVREVGLRLEIVGAGGLLIVKVRALEVPPPGAGLTTVTWAVPAVAMSPAAMAAVSWVAETKVVARGLPFQRTTELELKPLPVTVSVNAALPAYAVAGLRLVVVGTGLLTVKDSAFEVPPPGAGVTTVTLATPAVARSLVTMAAVSRVAETKVVVRGLPFHWTTESVMKPVPFTVRVKADPPARAVVGLRLPSVGSGFGTALTTLTEKLCAAGVPTPLLASTVTG
jgi:hypothetical protein